mmetsp:Transcript_20358/g.37777  ORF Transcript_20358/g.37777 Transcript_20358/m.37777 type:complete len:478 (+) Transcript_20358:55-1488(+)
MFSPMGALAVFLYVVLLVVLVEILFYIYAKCWLAPRLNVMLPPQAPWFKDTHDLLVDVFDKLKTIESAYTIETFLAGSFRRANLKDICSGNFDSFLAWALYTSHLSDTSDEQKSVISTHRKRIEDQFDLKFEEGFNSTIDHIKFNLDDLGYVHHPLALSLLVQSMELHSHLTNFYWAGFSRQSVGTGSKRGTYWIREKPDSRKSPMLFFHGICSGWFFYAKIIKAISSDRTIILYDYDCTKLNSLSFKVATAHDVNDHVVQILQKHEIKEKLTLFAHSWGTYLAGWIIRMNPHLVQHLVLVDPVCFVATFPETVYTVLYKESSTMEDYLLAYFLRADLTLSHTIHRHVSWFNIYFSFDYIPDDIAVTIGLASGDILLSFAALDAMSSSFVSMRSKKRTEGGGVAPCSRLVWDIPHAEAMTNDTCIAEIKLKLFEYDTAATACENSARRGLDESGASSEPCLTEALESPLLDGKSNKK